MAAKSQDKILFGAALCLLLASAGWMALQRAKLSELRTSSEVNITASVYEPAGIDAPTVSTKTWPSAPAQSSGDKWVYDVFTPPEIYYDDVTKQFTVTAPDTVKPELPKEEPPFGVELVQVRQDAFRLQLIGYVGEKGDYRGTFENTASGETVIGRAGKVIPDLGLTIKAFEVKHHQTLSADSMPIHDIEATAVVVDNATGDEVTLTNKRRHIKGTPFAILKAEGATETTQHKAGSQYVVGDVTYTVINVTAEPPSAEIRKESPDLTEPVTKTLTPSSPVAPVPASPESSEQPTTSTSFPFGT